MDHNRLTSALCQISFPVTRKDGLKGQALSNGVFISDREVLTCWHIFDEAQDRPITARNDQGQQTTLHTFEHENLFSSETVDLAVLTLDQPLGQNKFLETHRKSDLSANCFSGAQLVSQFNNESFVADASHNESLTRRFKLMASLEQEDIAHDLFEIYTSLAPVQPGYSGSPLVNKNGKIISILAAVAVLPEQMDNETHTINFGNMDDGRQKPFWAVQPEALSSFLEYYDFCSS